MSHRWASLAVAAAVLVFAACEEQSGTVVDELARVSDAELGTPILAFVYVDG